MNRKTQILNYYSVWLSIPKVTYRVPAKLMVAGGGNGQVIATVKFTGKFDFQKVSFRTFTGEEWPSELNPDKRSYTVTVKPGSTSGATDLLALYQPKGSDKPEQVGKLKVYTYNAVNKEVVLVPIAEATVPDGLADELVKIYKPYGVNLTVTSKKDSYPELWWDTDGDHLLDATGTSRLSRYSEEMKRLNSSYRLDEQGYFKKEALYLFVLAGAKTDDGLPLLGDMPRGKQFGYVFFSSPSGGGREGATTCAHELGHGIFRLAHTFDDYGYKIGSTPNLMDYSGGKELVKYQWDILHDPGIAGWLDDAADAEYSTDGHYYTVQLVALMMGFSSTEAYNLAVEAEEPDSKVKSPWDMEERYTWIKAGLQQQYHVLTGRNHGVELALTAYAMLKTHINEQSAEKYLLHRMGDCFGHIDTKETVFDVHINLIDYTQAVEKLYNEYVIPKLKEVNDDYLITVNIIPSTGMPVQVTKDMKFLKIYYDGKNLLTSLSIEETKKELTEQLLHSYSGETNLNFSHNRFLREELISELEKRLPVAVQNQYAMYGNNYGFTLGHLSDGRKPDDIGKRKELYLYYVDRLIYLLSAKYSK